MWLPGGGVVQSRADNYDLAFLCRSPKKGIFFPLQTALLFVWRRRAEGLEFGVSCGLHVWLELPEICKLITPRRPGDCSPQSPSSTNLFPTPLWGWGEFKGQERMQVCVHRCMVSRNLGFSCIDVWTQHPTLSPNKGT